MTEWKVIHVAYDELEATLNKLDRAWQIHSIGHGVTVDKTDYKAQMTSPAGMLACTTPHLVAGCVVVLRQLCRGAKKPPQGPDTFCSGGCGASVKTADYATEKESFIYVCVPCHKAGVAAKLKVLEGSG